MEITGIVCEFNPFHNGHKSLMESVKKTHKDSYIICLMSGHFVQRGEPALFDRSIRTKAALKCGADLVAELPVCYTLQSAEGFASGSVSVFNDIACVNRLAFGSEIGNIDRLSNLAEEIINNGDMIDQKIKNDLSTGAPYGKILTNAISEFCNEAQLLDQPNNLLAVEYIKAIKNIGSSIIPATYSRAEGFTISSASVLREMILSGNKDKAMEYVPDEIKNDYLSYPDSGLVTLNDFWSVICYMLRSGIYDISGIQGISEGFDNKLIEAAMDSTDYNDFISKVSQKRFSGSRLKRILISIMLMINKSDSKITGNNYLRVLGYRKESSGLLSEICRRSKCPVITQASELKEISTHNVLAAKDILASDLFAMAARQAGRKEFLNRLIVL